jgi:opacity protein-like surface antigen
MKQLIIAGIIGLASTAAMAGGEEEVSAYNFNYGPYVGIHGGAAIPNNEMVIGNNDTFNTGYDVGGQAGYQIGNLRLEGAFTFLNNSAKANNNVDLRLTTLMANGYYDFNASQVFAPFIGAGAGWVHAWTTSNQFPVNSPESNEFAYQVMAGVRLHIRKHFIWNVDYHRLSWTDGNGAQNLIEAGLSYAF